MLHEVAPSEQLSRRVAAPADGPRAWAGAAAARATPPEAPAAPPLPAWARHRARAPRRAAARARRAADLPRALVTEWRARVAAGQPG